MREIPARGTRLRAECPGHRGAGILPAAYFRRVKAEEARRLIREEGWQVKPAAYHLGYRHPNDLSRALAEKESR